MELKYEDFCKETKCMSYNLISRLNSIAIPNPVTTRSIEIAKVHCKQDCERTAYQFYQWLKSKGLVKLTSNF